MSQGAKGQSNEIDVVIPSYARGDFLVATIHQIFSQTQLPANLIIVDQTQYASGDVNAKQLKDWHSAGAIDWVRLDEPSIPKAMNRGLLEAVSDWILFLDDDIQIDKDFVAKHLQAIQSHTAAAQVGCVLHPGQQQLEVEYTQPAKHELWRDLHFPFYSARDATVYNCMAGNLMVDRLQAINCGGFDENFSGAAYRFETEFCRRLIASTGKPICYTAKPILHHLKAPAGGTRTRAEVLTSMTAHHSAGDYYFAFVHGDFVQAARYACHRLVSSVVARFYLRRPWYIPVRLVGEFRGLSLALIQRFRGPMLIQPRPSGVE